MRQVYQKFITQIYYFSCWNYCLTSDTRSFTSFGLRKYIFLYNETKPSCLLIFVVVVDNRSLGTPLRSQCNVTIEPWRHLESFVKVWFFVTGKSALPNHPFPSFHIWNKLRTKLSLNRFSTNWIKIELHVRADSPHLPIFVGMFIYR